MRSLIPAILAAAPNPFSTTAEPAFASARAMPNPIPLVDPVISETLSASGAVEERAFCVVSWIFMTTLSCDCGVLRQNLPDGRHLLKCRLASDLMRWRYRGSRILSAVVRLF